MDEYKLLKLEALKLKNKVFLPSIVFLLETGVNLKKLTNLYWRDIDVKGRILNGGIRLSDVAIIALNQAPVSKDGRVFGISISSLSYYINKVKRKLGILNLTLSDLKKEGQSRMNGLRVEFGLPRLDFGCGIWPNSKTGRGAIISIRRKIDDFYKHSFDNSNWMPEDAESFSDYNEKAQKVIKKVVGILLPSSWEAVFDHARVKGLDVFDLVEIIKKNIFLESHLET